MAKKPAAKTRPAARVAPMKAADPGDLTAKKFIERLKTFQSDEELRKIQRYFKSGEGQYAYGDTFIGVRMGHVFALAKAFVDMSPAEIEKLMESDIHEARASTPSCRSTPPPCPALPCATPSKGSAQPTGRNTW
jgi:hypothetical protein